MTDGGKFAFSWILAEVSDSIEYCMTLVSCPKKYLFAYFSITKWMIIIWEVLRNLETNQVGFYYPFLHLPSFLMILLITKYSNLLVPSKILPRELTKFRILSRLWCSSPGTLTNYCVPWCNFPSDSVIDELILSFIFPPSQITDWFLLNRLSLYTLRSECIIVTEVSHMLEGQMLTDYIVL